MRIILITIVCSIFAALLFLNLYFRIKVFKFYKILVQNRVEFGTVHIFDMKRLETEVLPRYPQHRDSILAFVQHIRYSVKLASWLIALITIFGGILMYYRHE
ncbi:MAG: hypothetical protein RL757_1241 [Bacteroidota bacterium]|jgi:hypothetical protein